MGDNSAIQWTDASWNPVTGCSKVSPGCANCYAESLTMRFADTWGVPKLPWTPENAAQNVILHPERLDQPLRWKRPRMVFVNSMSDLFHEQVPDEFIARVFAVMACAPHHTFQILTKRPERMRDLLTDDNGWVVNVCEFAAEWVKRLGRPLYEEDNYYCTPEQYDAIPALPNVWLGVSIENRRFTHRADVLRDTPAAVRFISAEPLLGPLMFDLDDYDGDRYWSDGADWHELPELDLTSIDWLIVGGESGAGHRPMANEWVRDLRDAAESAGTAFYMKQMGGLRPGGSLESLPEDLRVRQWPAGSVDIG